MKIVMFKTADSLQSFRLHNISKLKDDILFRIIALDSEEELNVTESMARSHNLFTYWETDLPYSVKSLKHCACTLKIQDDVSTYYLNDCYFQQCKTFNPFQYSLRYRSLGDYFLLKKYTITTQFIKFSLNIRVQTLGQGFRTDILEVRTVKHDGVLQDMCILSKKPVGAHCLNNHITDPDIQQFPHERGRKRQRTNSPSVSNIAQTYNHGLFQQHFAPVQHMPPPSLVCTEQMESIPVGPLFYSSAQIVTPTGAFQDNSNSRTPMQLSSAFRNSLTHAMLSNLGEFPPRESNSPSDDPTPGPSSEKD